MNDMEWRSIPGWEGFYEVSSTGLIRSMRRLARVNSVNPERKRWMGGQLRKLNRLKDGYLGVTLTAEGRRARIGVHVAVLMAFNRLPVRGEVARHLNGNPADNWPGNLAWGTHTENMADRKAHGNYAVGSSHHAAKLTGEDALAIHRSDEPGIVLARRYGVGPSTISRIRLGQAWGEITGGARNAPDQQKAAR